MNDTADTLDDLDRLMIARSFECEPNELSSLMPVHKNDFTLITQNIRGINCNFHDFLLTIAHLKFDTDVIVLTECRINLNKPLPIIPNYEVYSTTAQLNQNDGVVVYVKKTLRHKIIELQFSQASCLQLDILNNIIFCIYRSPSYNNAEGFVDSLNSHLENINTTKNIIITGDININITHKLSEQYYEHKNRTMYSDMLALHGILAGHTIPTRQINCLDHFMLKFNTNKLQASIAILRTSTTDHSTPLLKLSKIKKCIPHNKTKRTVNFEEAFEELKNQNLSDLLFCTDPTEVLNSLIYTLTNVLNKNTVVTNIPSKYRIIKPWITPGILRCIRNRNKLQSKLKHEPFNEILKITYIRYRNYCNGLIKKLKRKYDRELLAKSMKNNKVLWKNIKSITYTSNNHNNSNSELLNLKTSPTASVDFINTYFTNIGRELAQNIQPSPQQMNSYLRSIPALTNNFVLLPTDVAEVQSTLIGLKSNSASGWDCIPTSFLKLAESEVVPVISHLANLCFDMGIFPAPLKLSVVTPVYKGGERDDINNYRPISVLPAIAKIIEKLLNKRLLNFLNKFDILSSCQFGFQRGKSTEDAVLAFSSLVTENLDKGKKCLSVFLDLKKAFDTVSHPILIHKLERIGIRGTPLLLFTDYLSNRQQKVKVGEYTGGCAGVSYGVPQGSVLGPTLFLIYINDLCTSKVKDAKIFSYADDTAVVFCGKSWVSVRASAEIGLRQINKWLHNNILTLNAAKTNFICFSIYDNNQPPNDFNIQIHNCVSSQSCSCPSIQKVAQTKYLGVIVDQRLSWYPHLDHVIARIRKLLWIFKTLRFVMPRISADPAKQGTRERDLLKEIYIALVQSIIIYCIPVWGGAAKSKFIEVERAQRNLIKMMYFKKRRFSTEALYQMTKLASVRKLYIIHAVLKFHKKVKFDPKDLLRRRHFVVKLPKTNTTFANRQYHKRAARLYNTLNKALVIHSKTFHECRKILPAWLSSKCYDEVEELLDS